MPRVVLPRLNVEQILVLVHFAPRSSGIGSIEIERDFELAIEVEKSEKRAVDSKGTKKSRRRSVAGGRRARTSTHE
jgi:hypothetical protein